MTFKHTTAQEDRIIADETSDREALLEIITALDAKVDIAKTENDKLEDEVITLKEENHNLRQELFDAENRA